MPPHSAARRKARISQPHANKPVPKPLPTLQRHIPVSTQPPGALGCFCVLGGGMAPCQKLVFQARRRTLPERLSHLKTKAKFGPSPSGAARQPLCPPEPRPAAGAAASRGTGGARRVRPARPAAGTGAEGGRDTPRQVRGAPGSVEAGKRVWGEHGEEQQSCKRDLKELFSAQLAGHPAP